MNLEELINLADDLIYVIDVETHAILYANHCDNPIFPKLQQNTRPCYEQFLSRTEACPNCACGALSEERFTVREYEDCGRNSRYLLKSKLISWDGRKASLNIAIDLAGQELLSRETMRKLETERMLVECIRSLTEADNSREAVHTVLARMGGHYQSSYAFLLEIPSAGDCVRCTQLWHADGLPPWENDTVDLSKAPVLRSIIDDPHSRRLTAEDLRSSVPDTDLFSGQNPEGCFLVAPLPANCCRGVLGIAEPKSNTDDLRILESLSYFVGSELARRRMRTRLEYQNRHDALTGVENRLQFQNFLASPPAEGPIGVIFCDINGLKKINDLYGHSRGDNAIIQTADILHDLFGDCHIYRMGGDEFVVLCPGLAEEDFENRLGRAHTRLTGETDYGVSIGSSWSASSHDLIRLVELADQKMYLAKNDDPNSRR